MVPCTIVTGQKQDPSRGGMHRLNTTWQGRTGLFGQTFERALPGRLRCESRRCRSFWLVRGAISNAPDGAMNTCTASFVTFLHALSLVSFSRHVIMQGRC